MADEGREPDSGELLRWYIEKYETPYGSSSIPMSDQLRKVLTPAARLRAKQTATNALAPLARRRAARAQRDASPLRLHIGCGLNRLPGWVNIDLVGAATDIDWDLRRPLPFENGSADAIFSEHVLEHMTYREALTVLRHARAALRPGGVLRVGVPDAGMYATVYASDPEAVRTMRWGRATAMLALREVFQEHAHVAAYDGETLALVLREAGFPDARRTDPGVSEMLDEAPDMPERWHETVYLEVRKPVS